MITRCKAMLFGGCTVFALSMGALAQEIPEPVTVPAGLFDPQQLPTQRGQVQQFTLNPRGDIDGLILTDGTEVKTPPHLSTEIAYSVKPGDTITIHGLRAAALPLVQAVSITDEASGRTVVDNGPPGPRRGPAGPAAAIPAPTEVQGRIRMALHGRRGEINGALLEDGTVLRLPPPEAERLAALLQSGQTVVVEGTAFVNPLGKVLEVRRLGPSRDQLNQVQGPPGPGGKKGRRGPPPPA